MSVARKSQEHHSVKVSPKERYPFSVHYKDSVSVWGVVS